MDSAVKPAGIRPIAMAQVSDAGAADFPDTEKKRAGQRLPIAVDVFSQPGGVQRGLGGLLRQRLKVGKRQLGEPQRP